MTGRRASGSSNRRFKETTARELVALAIPFNVTSINRLRLPNPRLRLRRRLLTKNICFVRIE